VSDLDDDLRASADAIAGDAERLAAIETEKAALGSGDPRIVPLSREARRIAEALVPKTSAELDIATEANPG
jgi:hypothetical protein